jgi:hypothetical protein
MTGSSDSVGSEAGGVSKREPLQWDQTANNSSLGTFIGLPRATCGFESCVDHREPANAAMAKSSVLVDRFRSRKSIWTTMRQRNHARSRARTSGQFHLAGIRVPYFGFPQHDESHVLW